MSIATGELADWPKAPGVSAGRTDARVPHFSRWPRLLGPPSFAAAANGGGISSAAPVGSSRLHSGGEVVIFVTWGAKNGQEWI